MIINFMTLIFFNFVVPKGKLKWQARLVKNVRHLWVLGFFLLSCRHFENSKRCEGILISANINFFSENYFECTSKTNISFLVYFYNNSKDTVAVFVPNSLTSYPYSAIYLLNDNDTLGQLTNVISHEIYKIIKPNDTLITHLHWKNYNGYEFSINDVISSNKSLTKRKIKIVYKLNENKVPENEVKLKAINFICNEIVVSIPENYEIQCKFNDTIVSPTDSIKFNYKNKIPRPTDTTIVDVF